MTMIISPIPIVSGGFRIPIITILIGIVHSHLAGAIPIIHGIIHIMDGIHGVIIHGDGIPGTIRGAIIHIATIRGAGATIAGIHPIIPITIMDTMIQIGITTNTVMIIIQATGVRGAPTQYMVEVEQVLI
jgi:hypothetical protein